MGRFTDKTEAHSGHGIDLAPAAVILEVQLKGRVSDIDVGYCYSWVGSSVSMMDHGGT